MNSHWVRLSPIAQDSSLLALNPELEPYSSSDVAVRSPKPAMDRQLGRAFTSPTT